MHSDSWRNGLHEGEEGNCGVFLSLDNTMTVCAGSKFSPRLTCTLTRRGRGWWGVTRVGYLGAFLRVFETESSQRPRNIATINKHFYQLLGTKKGA